MLRLSPRPDSCSWVSGPQLPVGLGAWALPGCCRGALVSGGEEAAFHTERGQLNELLGVPGVQDKLSAVPAASSQGPLRKPVGGLSEKK